MSAEQEIAALDDALGPVGSSQGVGEDVRLRMVVGTTNQQNVDVWVRARVTGPTEQQLIAGMDQSTFNCILSPSQINRAQWPGGQPPHVTLDPRIPSKNRGDKAYVRGGWRAVQWAQGFYPSGELVRIEMRVLG